MALNVTHLRKLLQIFYATPSKRVSLIRSDIRSDIAKQNEISASGGDFYGPFWADAKSHVIDGLDLRNKTDSRIKANSGRARLYPQLTEGFLEWWNNKRRWTNEPLQFFSSPIKGRYVFEDIGTIVKVENLLAVQIGDGSARLIYPYFSERPSLPDEGARIGLWLMSVAIPRQDVEDLRILDVIRGKSFSPDRLILNGNEEDIFRRRYKNLLGEWEELWEEYF